MHNKYWLNKIKYFYILVNIAHTADTEHMHIASNQGWIRETRGLQMVKE